LKHLNNFNSCNS